MKSYLILYPAFLMILLTFFIYLKNRLDANKAYKSGEVEAKYLNCLLYTTDAADDMQ